MNFSEWLQSFPMHRTKQGKTPGKSVFFRLDVRVHRDGFGFMTEPEYTSDPQPVPNEEKAVEAFRALWQRALAEAKTDSSSDASS